MTDPTQMEQDLARELRSVADALEIPPLPELPPTPARPATARRWPVLMAAAVVVLIVAGVAFAVARGQLGGDEIQPAPRPDTPTVVSDGPPEIPVIVDQKLYVDGEQVPGSWSFLRTSGETWVALRSDGDWWFGTDPTPQQIEATIDGEPALSPDGRYVAYLDSAQQTLVGFETSPGGEGFGSVGIDVGSRENGSLVTVRAVTDTGQVVAQGTRSAALWQPLEDGGGDTIDLTRTAPGIEIVGARPGGVIASDGAEGPQDGAFEAQIAADGTVTRGAALPAHDDLLTNPAGDAWVYTSPNSTQGDVFSLLTLQVGGTRAGDGTLEPPATATEGVDWGFATRQWLWESDDALIAPLLGTRENGEETSALARCSISLGRCVLIESP